MSGVNFDLANVEVAVAAARGLAHMRFMSALSRDRAGRPIAEREFDLQSAW
jgi:hypothetical protein